MLVALAKAQQLPFMAAALAYYAFLSVIPLLIVMLTIVTAVAGQTLAERVLASVGEFLTPEAATLVEETLVDAPGRSGVTAVGLLVLLWGSLRVFRGLDLAFSRVYGNTLPKSLPAQLRDALLVFGAVGLAISATVIAGILLSRAPVPLARISGPVGLLLVLPPVFFPLYYVFPDSNVTLREAVPGTLFAGVGWTLLGTVFGIYAAQAGSFELYGVLGGVLLLLVWFYFGGLILLLGAAVNAVVADRFEYRQLQQGGLRGSRQQATMSDDGPTDRETGGTDDSGDAPADTPRESESAGGTPTDSPAESDDTDRVSQAEVDELRAQLDRLEEQLDDRAVERAELDDFEEEIESRTVHREEIEADLRQYVRRRVRRGHARGWGPYLVLLYGTAMTLGAFFFLGGLWAILAMLVIWLSTLGLYVLMLIVGATTAAISAPGRVLDRLRSLR
jgi:YihY family inner membrane protein